MLDVRPYPDDFLFCAYTLAVDWLRYALISFLAEPAHLAAECTWADSFLPAPLVVCQATGAAFHDQTVLLFRFDWLCWHILNLHRYSEMLAFAELWHNAQGKMLAFPLSIMRPN